MWQPEATTRRDLRQVRDDEEPPPTQRTRSSELPCAKKEHVTANLTRDKRYER